MREFRKRARSGIPFWRIRDRIEAARAADAEAEDAADAETERRAEEQRQEQTRLDDAWTALSTAREAVTSELPKRVAAETARCDKEHADEQKAFDDHWRRLQDNDPDTTLAALEQAFADNEAPAAAIDCDGDRTTVVMQFVAPEAIVPERKPARTPTGKRTLKKRTKTEVNGLYLAALGSNVLATVKETFAVAPGAELVQILVVRREADGKPAAIYAGSFDRAGNAGPSGTREPARSLGLAGDALLDLKGRAATVSPLDLRHRDDLAEVLEQVAAGLGE